MKTISLWALFNPVLSRAIIAVCYLFLAVAAAYLGVLLFAEGVVIPRTVFNIGFGAYLVAIICYPIRRARFSFWKKTFLKQKSMDALIVGSYVAMVVSIANFDAHAAFDAPADGPVAVPIVFNSATGATAETAPEASVWTRKGIEKKYKNWVVKVKTARRADATKGGEITAMILVLLLLFFGIVALSCTIACSDFGVLALIFLIGGTALLILLGIRWGRNIQTRSLAREAARKK